MGEIKLEVGQRVRLRNGAVYVVKANRWKFRVGCGMYLESGKYFDAPGESDIDVVEILPPEPTPAPEPKWEIGKWYPCRNGIHEGKVLEAGLPGKLTYCGIRRSIKNPVDWVPESWSPTGKVFGDEGDHCDLDLMLSPPEPKRHKVTFWFNCYREGGKIRLAGCHQTREIADQMADKSRFACIERTIEFTDGEGLS